MVLRRGRSVSTTMECAWKYGQSFFVATRRANATCSRWLYRVFALAKDLLTKNTGLCFLLSSSLNRAALIETSETAKYTKSVSPASGLARTRGSATYYLIVVRASSHSSFHPAWLAPLRVTKNGFRRSVNREMNRPRAANRPVNCCLWNSYRRCQLLSLEFLESPDRRDMNLEVRTYKNKQCTGGDVLAASPMFKLE